MIGMWATVAGAAVVTLSVTRGPLRRLHAEGRRKALHIGLGLLGAGFVWLFTHPLPVVLVGGSFTLLMLTLRTRRGRRLLPRTGRRLRHALGGHGRNAGSYGDACFAAGITLAFVISYLGGHHPMTHLAAVLTLTFADPAATALGRRVRSPRLASGKSLVGSLTFTLIAACVLVGLETPPLVALPIALAAAVVECFCPRGTDNLGVPLTVAALHAFTY